MIFSDRDIKKYLKSGRITVDPLVKEAIQPASVDLRLDSEFMIFKHTSHAYIDVAEPVDELMKKISISGREPFVLHPGEFALGLTFETVGVDDETVARLEGKSSLGRLGVIVHATAGFIDPGNCLKITLELHNVGNLPVILRYKMPIAQVAFQPLSSKAERPYGSKKLKSKYYKSKGIVMSQMHKNFKKK
ncbi:dCTP deaminase [Patescibacteria group bacterium]|nr:dCTP deaminase [Patescibacteria group bacterium]